MIFAVAEKVPPVAARTDRRDAARVADKRAHTTGRNVISRTACGNAPTLARCHQPSIPQQHEPIVGATRKELAAGVEPRNRVDVVVVRREPVRAPLPLQVVQVHAVVARARQNLARVRRKRARKQTKAARHRLKVERLDLPIFACLLVNLPTKIKIKKGYFTS